MHSTQIGLILSVATVCAILAFSVSIMVAGLFAMFGLCAWSGAGVAIVTALAFAGTAFAMWRAHSE